MPKINFQYGDSHIQYNIPDPRFRGELVSQLHSYKPSRSPKELIQHALANPIGSPKLSAMAKGKQKIVIICSDHTRPVPSKIIIPAMLAEIRMGNPNADITLLIATGCHRSPTQEELEIKFGPDILKSEKIVIHDCDHSEMLNIGKLPSGGSMIVNKLAVEADLLCAEGFIEPHFFAGFSGGRKSLFPGVCSRKTVAYNHNAEFIAHPHSRTGILEGNLIHNDMLYAARVAGLAFICNVVINANKEAIFAVAGDVNDAHIAGTDFLSSKCRVKAEPADIVISTNGGYPLDQNIYQAVKGMTAAEATVKKDGIIIMLARSNDGHGGEMFYKTFKEEKDIDRMLEKFHSTAKEETIIDQWQSQIFARVLQHAKVIYVSEAADEIVEDLHMKPAKTLDEAMKMAEEYLGNPNASVTAIPDGVSVMVMGG